MCSLPSARTAQRAPWRATRSTRHDVRIAPPRACAANARTTASYPPTLGYVKWSWCSAPSVGIPIALLTTSSSGGFGTRDTHASAMSRGSHAQILRLYGRKYRSEMPRPKVAYAHSSRLSGALLQSLRR